MNLVSESDNMLPSPPLFGSTSALSPCYGPLLAWRPIQLLSCNEAMLRKKPCSEHNSAAHPAWCRVIPLPEAKVLLALHTVSLFDSGSRFWGIFPSFAKPWLDYLSCILLQTKKEERDDAFLFLLCVKNQSFNVFARNKICTLHHDHIFFLALYFLSLLTEIHFHLHSKTWICWRKQFNATWMQICIPNHCTPFILFFSCGDTNNTLTFNLSCDLNFKHQHRSNAALLFSSLCFCLSSCSFKAALFRIFWKYSCLQLYIIYSLSILVLYQTHAGSIVYNSTKLKCSNR